MRLIDADRLRAKITAMVTKPHEFMYEIERAPTVDAIPVEVFYKMIHNALADTKKENWEPEECSYDYFDGNRNAIHCMLDILCGDKDGDHDKFWEDYSQWEEENE